MSIVKKELRPADLVQVVQYLPGSFHQIIDNLMGKIKDTIVCGVAAGIANSGLLGKLDAVLNMNSAAETSELTLVDSKKQLPDLKKCSVEGCDRPSRAKGLCTRHYQMKRYVEKNKGKVSKRFRKGSFDGGLSENTVERTAKYVQSLKKPRKKPKKHKENRPCDIEGCGRPALTRGLCSRHYQIQRRIENNEKYHVGEKRQIVN